MADSPQARAKARREAILSARGNRLAKLTTSARGEEAAAAIYSDDSMRRSVTPSGLRDFVGEETRDMPTPPPIHLTAGDQHLTPPSSQDNSRARTPDPSAWSSEQQQQFMQALLGGGPPNVGPNPTFPNLMKDSNESDDPLSTIMSQIMTNFSQSGASSTPPSSVAPEAPPKPKTLFQRLLPLIHVLSTLVLLFYFVVHIEPAKHAAAAHLFEEGSDQGPMARWARWAQLAKRQQDGWGVQVVPIFWTFVVLQLSLHSLRLFSESREAPQLPSLLAIVLPHLPPPIPSVIITGMKYLKMVGMVLDDLSVFIFALGVVVWFSGWAL
jgi:hypothetical protein